MDNLININNTKANTLEFEMTIEGANASDVECHFVIAAKSQEFRFKAKKEKTDNIWTVKIPAMPYLERTAYKCYTEVVTDGQYFTPMKGNVNVVGSTEIYTSTPKNQTVESDIKKKEVAKKEDVKREEKRKNESWRQGEKGIEQIARELMARKTTIENKPILEKRDVKPAPVKPDSVTTDDIKTAVKTVTSENMIAEAVKNAVAKTVESNPNMSKADKLKAILKETKAAHPKISPHEYDAKLNEELVKTLIEKKEKELRESVKAAEIAAEDPREAKIRAILEESGIKPKEKTKKEKVSFVRTRLLN